MLNKKLFIISTAVLLTIALIFMSLYLCEKKHSEEIAITYLNSILLYVQTQLSNLTEALTQDEWEQRISYLQMASVGQGLRSIKKYGDCNAVCEAITLLSYVPYDYYQEALALIRELRISVDTQNLLVDVVEGDIEYVIRGLEVLQPV